MIFQEAVLERASAKVEQAQEKVKCITGADVAVHPDPDAGTDLQLGVELEGRHMAADLLVDFEREVMVAQNVEAEKPQKAKQLLMACECLGAEVECGSLLVRPEASADVDDISPDEAWERAGFRKNYFLPVDASAQATDSRKPDEESEAEFEVGSTRPLKESEGLLDEGRIHRYHARVQRAVGRDLEWGVALSERPYIVSLDVADSLEKGEESPFHCYLHFHELTGACYVEKIVLPHTLRGRGIGRRVVREVLRLCRGTGVRYVYLVAKKDAEGFWEKQGFLPLHRVNYRNRRRRLSALRKRPGWDVARVKGERLRRPVWHYRNHPQDDLDFASALDILNLASSPRKSRP